MNYNNMSMRDIVDNLKTLCESGLRTSSLHQFRKAIRELSRDMYKDPKRYKKPFDRGLMIETKAKPIIEKTEEPPKVKKVEEPEVEEQIETEIKHIIE